MSFSLFFDDCLNVLPTLPAESVDCVITDPPYPEIDREYGRMTEADWMVMMQAVVKETRRILKPTGSAVFILQPNAHRLGCMRGWLWEFLAWVCREWNMIQDVYWWNIATMPQGYAIQGKLMRPSVKFCLWMGDPGCYKNQEAVLWAESEKNARDRMYFRANPEKGKQVRYTPSGAHGRDARVAEAAERRGGVTPYNCLPLPNSNSMTSAGANGHSAGTPLKLCDWWTRYICPPGGVVLDPFAGSGTTGIAAAQNGCGYIGIEKFPRYRPILQERVQAAYAKPRQAEMAVRV